MDIPAFSSALMRPRALSARAEARRINNSTFPRAARVSCGAFRVPCPTRAGAGRRALPHPRGWEAAHCARLANAAPLATRGRRHLAPRGLQARPRSGAGWRRLARRRRDLRRNRQRGLRRSLQRALDLARAREASRAGTAGCRHHRRATRPPWQAAPTKPNP